MTNYEETRHPLFQAPNFGRDLRSEWTLTPLIRPEAFDFQLSAIQPHQSSLPTMRLAISLQGRHDWS